MDLSQFPGVRWVPAAASEDPDRAASDRVLGYVHVDIILRRVSDGAERVCVDSAGFPARNEWHDGLESAIFWWTDGNGGCDCNRALFFARAGGEEAIQTGDLCIGRGAYELVGPAWLAAIESDP